jgi:hypothetical protein
MRNIVIPMDIGPKGLNVTKDPKQAIDQMLTLLLGTPCYSSVADPQFGFVFNNMRFEIFNENEGVVYNSSESTSIFEGQEGLYNKKITGSSKNLNTFAAELKDTIMRYEKTGALHFRIRKGTSRKVVSGLNLMKLWKTVI